MKRRNTVGFYNDKAQFYDIYFIFFVLQSASSNNQHKRTDEPRQAALHLNDKHFHCHLDTGMNGANTQTVSNSAIFLYTQSCLEPLRQLSSNSLEELSGFVPVSVSDDSVISH
jgi:hypothetical protein